MKGTPKAAPAQADAPKKERKVLTPKERVAKLEAELEAARKKAAEKEAKATDAKREKRNALVTRRNALNVKIEALNAEIAEATIGSENMPAEGTEPEGDES